MEKDEKIRALSRIPIGTQVVIEARCTEGANQGGVDAPNPLEITGESEAAGVRVPLLAQAQPALNPSGSSGEAAPLPPEKCSEGAVRAFRLVLLDVGVSGQKGCTCVPGGLIPGLVCNFCPLHPCGEHFADTHLAWGLAPRETRARETPAQGESAAPLALLVACPGCAAPARTRCTAWTSPCDVRHAEALAWLRAELAQALIDARDVGAKYADPSGAASVAAECGYLRASVRSLIRRLAGGAL